MIRGLQAEAEALRQRAEDVAGPLAARARRSTTAAQQRAILRMFGVDGLDRRGQPLAGTLFDRYCGSDATRLASGVALPFAMTLLEYDLAPRALALEIAAGTIDLRLEEELLRGSERHAAAEAEARRLAAAALSQVDENRIAARELRSVFADPDAPWLALDVDAAEMPAARRDVADLVRRGADVVRVRVPASWELVEARREPLRDDPAGPRPGRFRKKPSPPPIEVPRRDPSEPVPAGSQRGLAELRRAADEAATARGRYASLMTVTSAFAAPEQAVVAALERIDLVEADPIREIVEDNVDPDRALADHAFARRLHARSGCGVVIGPGPLAIGVDLATGIPSDSATRTGRALALQALGVALALADGLPGDRLYLGVVPGWVASEGDPTSVLAQAWLRRLLFPGSALVVEEPAAGEAADRPPSVLPVALVAARPRIVLRSAGRQGADVGELSAGLRAAAASAAAMAAAFPTNVLEGRAAAIAARTLASAIVALDNFAAEGWSALLGAPRPPDELLLGRSGVAESLGTFDALEPVPAAV